jgi:DNA primase
VTVRPSPIEAARERHRLADVARRTAIFLPTTAGTVTVRCPIPAHGHPDRTPSMRLYLDDDRYYCFGCGAKGDVIQWVRDTEGLGVTEAVSHLDSQQPLRNAWAGIIPAGWLARRAGSGPTDGPDPARTPRRMVLATLEAAWVRYSTGEGHQAGTAYLAGREIDIAVLERVTGRAEVGYTSPGSHGLVDVLRADGFTDDQLVDAGLARRVAGGEHTIDAYRQRALVPVRTEDGDVCGLVGRSVARSDAPKYLNPPRTAVYDKSINLYCPLPAPPHRRGTAVVVEGTLDALAVATTAVRAGLAGRLWPVTQSGRELSSGQVEQILAATDRPTILALDADSAGREATARLSQAFANHHRSTASARLPEGHDPASLLAGVCGRSPHEARAALVALTGCVLPRPREAGPISRSPELAPVVSAEVGL